MPKNKRSNSASRAAKRGRPPESNVVTPLAAESGDAGAHHSAPPSRLVWRPIYALIPPLLALITSINSLRNGFAFDDEQQLLRNEFIKSLANLPGAFTTSVWSFMGDTASLDPDAYYRPLFTTLFTINYAVFGTTAWGWHLVNVLVHAGVTLLVWLVLKEVTNREGVSAIAAALFAVHPVHAEPVAWISGVTDPWLALFVLPAFYFYLRYHKDGRKRLMAAAVCFYFLALLSKETAIVLPAAQRVRPR
ncbi:MAG: glycosyltransferase family 39 protein [Acidobacteriota bacterium]